MQLISAKQLRKDLRSHMQPSLHAVPFEKLKKEKILEQYDFVLLMRIKKRT